MARHSPDLKISVTNDGTRSRLELVGQVDLSSVKELRDQLGAILEAGIGDLEVDMHGVEFCDSAGLHALLDARHQLATAGRGMSITNPSPIVIRLLHIAGLAQLFAVPD